MINKKILTIKLLVTMIAIGLSMIRCTTQVKDYIPGSYTTAWTTEFTEARDTIQIAASTGSSGTYAITRRTYMLYQKKPQYKLLHWTGVYDSKNKTLVITKNGRVLSFDPSNNEMRMGSTTYKKL